MEKLPKRCRQKGGMNVRGSASSKHSKSRVKGAFADFRNDLNRLRFFSISGNEEKKKLIFANNLVIPFFIFSIIVNLVQFQFILTNIHTSQSQKLGKRYPSAPHRRLKTYQVPARFHGHYHEQLHQLAKCFSLTATEPMGTMSNCG
ncbi:hypothetical protein LX36DRAFT_199444 [Colletotrichum falcatum]|nr:hypothetical protein LX36DRAFT_199444 [Colletotrichum falcatum]